MSDDVRRKTPEICGKRVRPFGPGDRLLGYTTKVAGASRVGAVLWGMGIAQLRMARRLAALGVPSLQAKLTNRDFRNGHYSHQGIELCGAAMEKLAAEQNVDVFILIANCAFANIALNTAVEDRRVCALALSNPYLTKQQKLELQRWSLVKKIFDPRKWLRLFAGRVDMGKNLDGAFHLFTGRPTEKSTVAAERAQLAKQVGPDMLLPAKLDECIRELCARGVEIFYSFSSTELGPRYFEKHYRASIDELRSTGALRTVVLDTDVHSTAEDHEGAVLHTEALLEWLVTTNTVRELITSERSSSVTP